MALAPSPLLAGASVIVLEDESIVASNAMGSTVFVDSVPGLGVVRVIRDCTVPVTRSLRAELSHCVVVRITVDDITVSRRAVESPVGAIVPVVVIS